MYVGHPWGWISASALLAVCLLLPRQLQAQDVQVITSAERTPTMLDRQLLRAVFTMRLRTWPDGTATHVFVLPDTDPLHDRFCREQLGTYPYVLRSAWDRMVFTGTGRAPITVRNEAEMKERVRATPGAVGYASAGQHSFLPAYLLGMTQLALAGS